ncbi:MAG: NFACT family protein [Candidatus Aenigmarchaeota archaeon]|nr:NFACT family protein [Candidatus Aenigmarchaeota archaeon]
MAAELKSLDFRFLVRELRDSLLGGKFRKIYQYGQGDKQFLFEIYVSTKGDFWLQVDPGAMFLAQHRKIAPVTPPNFCMFLRKHLNGRAIKNIRQIGFDRIVEIMTDSSILILEFVPPGNVILCDRFYNVIMPMHVQRWRDRSILPRKPYRYPPGPVNTYNISFETWSHLLQKQTGTIKSVLARMGFGSLYAGEAVSLAKVDAEKQAGQLSPGETSELYRAARLLGERKAEPVSYEDGVVSPFPLLTKKEQIKGKWSSLSAPLDELFSRQVVEQARLEEAGKAEEKRQELERIVEKQTMMSEGLREKVSDRKQKADAIYSFYGLVEDILNGIRKAKDSGLGWAEIKSRIESEPTPEAEAIVEIREHEGTVLVNLGGQEMELDFRKSVEENAADYYEESKTARRKSEGAERAIDDKRHEISMIEESPPPEKPVIKKKRSKPRRRWFERMRWFVSSQKFLIVAGKDAASNERLIKRHTDDRDLVFHTDIQGSAFVVLKAKASRGTKFASLRDGQPWPTPAKKEASEIAAACSKAWSKGLGNIDVYAVRPDKVSKTPPSGTGLPKGSFMVQGDREWFRDVELKMSIGVIIDKQLGMAEIISGPVMAMRNFTRYFVTLRPGDRQSPELAREIKNKLAYKASPEERPLVEQLELDSISRLVPGGTGMIVG